MQDTTHGFIRIHGAPLILGGPPILSTPPKVDLYKTTVEPVLLYSSDTWTLTAKQQCRVDGAYTRLLR